MRFRSVALLLVLSSVAVQAIGAGPKGRSSDVACSANIGTENAMKYVRECINISPATHPPCNAANSCKVIIDEIKRGCGMGGAGLAMCSRSSNEDHSLETTNALRGVLFSEVVNDTDPKDTFTIHKLKLLHPIDVFDEDGGIWELDNKIAQVDAFSGEYPPDKSCVIVKGRLTRAVTLTDVYPTVIAAESINRCGKQTASKAQEE